MNLQAVREFVLTAHHGQKDAGGEDYYRHVFNVARIADGLLLDMFPNGVSQLIRDRVEATALLHDVVEDCGIPLDFIGKLTQDLRVQLSVRMLTRVADDASSYLKYIQGILDAPENWIAVIVKRADLRDNLSPFRMRLLPPKRRMELCQRYYAALDVLEGRTWDE